MSSVGDRWTLVVVDALLGGPLRFGELQAALPAIAPNVLTARLRHLEREGVVMARAYSERPVRMSYELTAAGRDLGGALILLTSWGARRDGGDDARHHDVCGTSLETRWYCPTCARTVDDDEADDLRHA